MRIYIIGFMGSGKSTFGKALSEALGFGFIDLDREIEKKEKATIKQLFEEKGEERFRKVEHTVLIETANEENVIIATGGGAPCFNDNMQWMNEHGITIYLKMFEGDLKKRIEPEMESRPLLNGIDADGLDNFIYKTLRARAFFYHQAKIVIDPLMTSPDDLASILKENYL